MPWASDWMNLVTRLGATVGAQLWAQGVRGEPRVTTQVGMRPRLPNPSPRPNPNPNPNPNPDPNPDPNSQGDEDDDRDAEAKDDREESAELHVEADCDRARECVSE